MLLFARQLPRRAQVTENLGEAEAETVISTTLALTTTSNSTTSMQDWFQCCSYDNEREMTLAMAAMGLAKAADSH